MSYSFDVTAPTKAAAQEAVHEKFCEVVEAQPIHACDKERAFGNAYNVIGLLGEDETKNVSVHCNGYIYRHKDGGPVTGVSIAASASLVFPKD
jgi:hypothetical protein